MRSGYNLSWSLRAQTELEAAYTYLYENWSSHSVKKLAKQVNDLVELIHYNPRTFPYSPKTNRYRAVVNKHYVMIYRLDETSHDIYILSFFNAHQNPDKHP